MNRSADPLGLVKPHDDTPLTWLQAAGVVAAIIAIFGIVMGVPMWADSRDSHAAPPPPADTTVVVHGVPYTRHCDVKTGLWLYVGPTGQIAAHTAPGDVSCAH